MRQEPGPDAERPDPEGVAGREFVQVERVVEHARPVERQDGAQGARQGEGRQCRGRYLPQGARAEQRVQVRDVIGVPVADEDRVDGVCRDQLEQPWEDRIAGVDQQPEPGLLDQVPAARATGGRPGAGAPQDRQLHGLTIASRARTGISPVSSRPGRG
jgi:hypothetical protein